MFLKIFKPKINSLRFKKKISSALSNFKNVFLVKRNFFKTKTNSKNKFLKKTNYVYNVNINDYSIASNFVILNYIKIQYSNKFLSFCINGEKEIFIKPSFYGFSFTEIYDSSVNYMYDYLKIKKIEEVLYNYNFVFLFKTNSPFFNLSINNNKMKYAASAGTFCLYTNYDSSNNILYIRIPSKKILQTSFNVKAFLGRSANIFAKFYNFTSFKQKNILKKHMPKVRGVAMNAFEHPNGGSSKTKRPLKTP